MNPAAEFDLIIYGSTGYTGRLVAEYLAARYGVGGEVKWAMAGRSADKLAEVRDEIGAPANTPLIVANTDDPASLDAMVRRGKAVITTVGPYQLYGEPLVAACAAAGTDYLDLTGEPLWMYRMIERHSAAAKASGARILFSCGFDSIPFEAGVWFLQETAKQQLGAVVPRAKTRVRGMRGGFSGGTFASMTVMMQALQKDPTLMPVLINPFALTEGFQGPAQPPGQAQEYDPDIDAWVGPFIMANINTRNVHRANFLLGHPWGKDFVYDEMTILAEGKEPPSTPPPAADLGLGGAAGAGGGPKPGEGPTKEEREAGYYDILLVGISTDGRQVRVSVSGTEDPGYASTSKMLAEAGLALVKDRPDTPGGIWVPGAALGQALIDRLRVNANIKFEVES